jgi:hypothetical protein
MSRALLTLLLCVPALSWASCPTGEALVFACKTDTRKEIRVCQGSNAITFRSGKALAMPDLALSHPNTAFHWEHGEGVSSGVEDVLVFRNGEAHYVITHTANFDDRTDVSAYLTALQSGKEPRFIECKDGIRFDATAIKARARPMSEGVPAP